MKNLVIDKRVIRSNLRAVKERADGATIYADLSGDAYGMGLLETAKLLRDEGVCHFIVSDPRDARLLRERGFTQETIMMLRSTADSDELGELIDLGVVCTIGSSDAAVALNGIAEERKTVCEVQIKIDTGLGRYGFSPTDTDKIEAVYKYMPNLAVVGTFTTFSASWKSKKQTLMQLETFERVLNKLTAMGLDVGLTHACDSAALFKYDIPKMDAVRVGEALAGRIPGGPIQGLRRVGYIAAGIEEICWFSKGHTIGGTVKLKKPTKLAVVSVGYYHGFGVSHFGDASRRWFFRDRATSNGRFIRIGSQKARVVGEIGMMHVIADVTKIECTVGDTAILDVDPINVKGLPTMYKTE